MTVYENSPSSQEVAEEHQDEEAEERFDDESLASTPSSTAIRAASLEYLNEHA
jgi:hypothetical protein